MKLGIFDSGIGGEAIATALREAFPHAEILTADDREHLPYGDRTAEDIALLTEAAIQPLLEALCELIIIACNSATAAAIDTLRSRYPRQLFVGLEPMVKPAALITKTGVIAVCATPATLGSPRYQQLKDRYAQSITVIEPDCSQWAHMIEHRKLEEAVIRDTVHDLINDNVDVIVLACTHYHWIRRVIEKATDDKAIVIDPTNAIVNQIRRLLA